RFSRDWSSDVCSSDLTLKNPELELMNENHNADVKVEEKEEKNFYDMMGYPKVTLNKNVRAYTLSIKNKKNGIDGELKTIEPNIRSEERRVGKESRTRW